MKNADMREIESFVATILLDQTCDREPITQEEAGYTLREWEAIGVELPENITACDLATAWNELIKKGA